MKSMKIAVKFIAAALGSVRIAGLRKRAVRTAPQREVQLRQQALDAARDALRLEENQYRAGTVDYLNVISAQNTALQTERDFALARK